MENFEKETIAAIATALSDSGIGIVRISGENAIYIVDSIFRSTSGKKILTKVQSHTIHYGYIVDKDENIIDEVMTSVMKAPKSYTMEDTVEINCHGGVLVMQKVLEKRRDIHVIAKKILEAKDLFMIGRGLDYSILLEGSLKLKEVSYIHSEAYASGELKHGPIALITTNTPVVATVTQEKLMSKELSNIKEVKSRGADIVLFIKEALSGDLDTEYQVIRLPDMQDEFMVLPASVALQLLAYYVSSDKGFDVDKPRNLAKVVTVE